MGKAQHITKSQNGDWGVKGEKNSKYTKLFDTQKEAIEYGKQIAKNQESELIIHGKDGKIREKDSFGNDPINIPG